MRKTLQSINPSSTGISAEFSGYSQKAAFFVVILLAALYLTGCSSPSGLSGDYVAWDFETAETGGCPAGWSQQQWGEGTPRWAVEQEEAGRVFGQLASENPNGHFNLAVYDGLLVKDGTLTVRLRARTGKHDQGGGIVWRYQDEENHYIVRANPLEDNVVLYKMENGVRTDLPLLGAGRTYGVKVSKLGTDWHTLKLVALDDEFTVWLDGRELFRVRDRTHVKPGKIGLWTKADAVTWFDDLTVEVD